MKARALRRFAVLALSLAVGAPAAARADVGSPLGSLEQQSLTEALAARGLRLEPRPEGKTIRAVHVVNQEVFSQDDWYFQLLNIFHRTTREGILARELLVKPGQVYDQALVEESIRNLQDPPSLALATGRTFFPPELSSVVVIVPVASPLPGTVDILAVTRDLWSLRFNTNFEFQQNTLSLLATSLSENNLFGWRKYVALNYVLDLGKAAVGPTYFDPNVLGTRLMLYASAAATYTRGTTNYEGNSETASLRYPLFSLASRWGGGVGVLHQDLVARSFLGTSPRPVIVCPAQPPCAPTDPGATTVPFVYRSKFIAVDANVVRQFPGDIQQQLTAGYHVDDRTSEVLPDFPADAATAQRFLGQYAPLSELRSGPYLQYDMFTPVYVVFRDLATFDLRENRRLGPSMSLGVSFGVPELGADFRTFGMAATVGWAVAPRGGYGSISATGAARLFEGRLADQQVGASLFAASPILHRLLRVVVGGQINGVRADTGRTLFSLGGDTGLRGYAIGDQQGTAAAIGHVELRSMPVSVFSTRLGATLFYDVGDAGPSFTALQPLMDFGVGLRLLIPQLNSTVIRADWAIATESTFVQTTCPDPVMPMDRVPCARQSTAAGFPGRFSAGFMQVF